MTPLIIISSPFISLLMAILKIFIPYIKVNLTTYISLYLQKSLAISFIWFSHCPAPIYWSSL